MNRKSKNQIVRIVLKAIALLCIINFIFITVKDIPIGNPSLYNTVYPGRSRFPFGEQPEISYNLTMNNLDAMLASHEINQNNDNDLFEDCYYRGETSFS